MNTYCPLEVCRSNVTKVEIPGHTQLFASRAYLNSSSHTTCSANFTWTLFSGRNSCTYCGHSGAKSFTAQERRIVCWSCIYRQKDTGCYNGYLILTVQNVLVFTSRLKNKPLSVFFTL